MDRFRNIRLTPGQDEALRDLARKKGLDVSSFVRSTLIEVLSLPTDAENGHVMSNDATPTNGAAIGEHPNTGGAS